jgi:YbbR domain-containing protein
MAIGAPALRHIGLKVVSIGLAALLWLVVSGEQIVERALRIPLEFANLPTRLELVGDAPDVVDVRVRGSSGALSRIATGELVAILDLRSARPGQRLFHLVESDVRAPFGIDVVQVTPSSISMRFEPSVTKVVPIVPGVEGEPAPGFVVGTVTAAPATVEVLGPAGALESLTEAITEPVSVAGAAGPITETVTVGSPDPSVRLRSPQTARVTVNVTAAPVEWTVAGVVVQVRNATRPVQVVPRVVTVRVHGPRDARAESATDFDASVDVSGLRPGHFELPVRIVPPARVGVLSVEPAQVRVTIR